ncbi:MAG: hypothetical protein ACTSUE_10135 [Promethearchaeota archaeon]
MMKASNLWKIATKVKYEVFVLSQLQMAGSQRERMVEKYRKNIKSAKTSNTMQTVIVSIFLAFLGHAPFSALMKLQEISITSSNVQGITFALALTFSIFFAMQFLFMMTFKLMSLVSLMDGSCFKFLLGLPFSKRDLSTVSLFTFIQINIVEIIVMVLTFPFVSILVSGSILFFLVALGASAANMLIALFVQIKVGGFVARKIVKTCESSRSQVIVRVIFFAIYFSSFMMVSMSFSFLLDLIDSLFSAGAMSESLAGTLNLIFPLTIFPFGASYISALVLVDVSLLPPLQIYISIASFTILILLVVLSYKRGTRSIYLLVSERAKLSTSRTIILPSDIDVRVEEQKKMLIKTNLLNMTRDFGNLIYFLIAIMMPLLASVPTVASSGGSVDTLIIFFEMNSYIGLLPFMSHLAISGAEERVGGLFSALPVRSRMVYRARFQLIALNLSIGFLINTVIVAFFVTDVFIFLIMQVVGYLTLLLLVTFTLLLFSVLFGKINGRYTLFSANIRRKTMKYILIILVNYITFIFVGTSIVFATFVDVERQFVIYLIVTSVLVAMLILMEMLMRKMIR